MKRHKFINDFYSEKCSSLAALPVVDYTSFAERDEEDEKDDDDVKGIIMSAL